MGEYAICIIGLGGKDAPADTFRQTHDVSLCVTFNNDYAPLLIMWCLMADCISAGNQH